MSLRYLPLYIPASVAPSGDAITRALPSGTIITHTENATRMTPEGIVLTVTEHGVVPPVSGSITDYFYKILLAGVA